MDPVTATFYALICGGLAGLAPAVRTVLGRVIVGGVTGVIASVVLPSLRGLMGL
jgi:hypothetical protein